MYVHWPTLVRGITAVVRRRPFRIRRFLAVVLVSVAFAIVLALVALGRAADRVLYGDYQRVVPQAPIFIIAPPRSGTTFLHRLMSLDTERMVHFRLIDMILPAIVFARLFSVLAKVDRYMGGALGWALRRFERLCFGDWENRHQMGFGRPEEDEALFTLTLVTEAVYLLFPFFDTMPQVAFLDRMGSRTRAGAMGFYRTTVQRHLHAQGHGRTLLAKSTGAPGRIHTLLATFPDARIVHLVRHPDETIPSHLSTFYPSWQALSPEIAKVSPETEAYAEIAVDWYRAMYDARDLFTEDRYIRLRYTDLIEDPLAAVESIYRQFGLPLDDAFRQRLQAACRTARRYRSDHSYSLAEFGLSRAWVDARLGDIIASYGLECPSGAASGPIR